jgi:DNA-binding transcriptional MerR regulator
MHWTVSDLAKRTKLTVRTLHHYDRIGLVKPSRRTGAGYRLYAPDDLERLKQVLFFRELGFALEDIRRIMASRSFERRRALVAQRALLERKAARVHRMIEAIDRSLGAVTRGELPAHEEEEFEMFADFDPKQYEEEVQRRWGQTESYKESRKRTAKYSPADWAKIKDEAAALNAEMADAMERGVAPGSAEGCALAERARLHIDRWYYPCSKEHHVRLGEMYVADPRFAETYEKVRTGLARWVCEAIAANSRR